MRSRAIVIAGTQSGSGKTTVTLGIMAALKEMGHDVAPFKCGPDFIDPSLHRLVTGKVSHNLDLWMAGEEAARQSFARHVAHADIGVIEGVMGMFDGGRSSSAALAGELGVPTILVIDVRSAAESVAAVLKGFEVLDPAVAPRGVIFNRIGSSRHLELVRQAVETNCNAEILGYLPRSLDFTIPERHLGLHMGEEKPISEEKVAALSRTVREHIDMDRLLEVAAVGNMPAITEPSPPSEVKIRLGVARDKAFCFYYEDNFDILRAAGAEICFFSPLADSSLPENLDAIYLGGGYPELHARELSSNTAMLGAIGDWAKGNHPLYAECGGFMYLTDGIEIDTSFYPMARVFPVKASMQKKRASLGYRELTTTTSSFFGPKGTVLRGHEFHYSRIEPMDGDVERIYDVNNSTTEGYRLHNVVGGYMHIHLGFTPQAAGEFVQFCQGR